MAHILLVDSDPVAQKAMKGILERGNHRLATVASSEDARDFIRSNVKVDLVFTELELKEESGLALIQGLKGNRQLKALPIVVYTAHASRETVKSVLGLQVQNFLLKPYRDEAVFGEIAKAFAWRAAHFTADSDFSQRSGLAAEQRTPLLEALKSDLEETQSSLKKAARLRDTAAVIEGMKRLTSQAARTGALGTIACVKELNEKVIAGDWSGFEDSLRQMDFAARIIFHRLNPEFTPEAYLSENEQNQEAEAREIAWWRESPEAGRCPVVTWPELQRKLDALSGCPVISSIAASFQMAANGHPTSLSPLLDLVQKDPGLTAQVLIASNRIKKGKGDRDVEAIEEPRIAVGLLGELRLAALGGSLATVEERFMLAPPQSSWPNFRAFQLGAARLARFVCDYLEMPGLGPAAYTASLLHDIGKLLLLHLYPFAHAAIQDYAQRRGAKLASAEHFFLGATTLEMAAHFAEKQGLPQRFVNTLRFMDDPAQANEDADLVAIVSLARDLCRHNRVGFNGDTPVDDAIPLGETREWAVLRNRVFLNFDLRKFERQAQLECLHIKRELQGQAAQRSAR